MNDMHRTPRFISLYKQRSSITLGIDYMRSWKKSHKNERVTDKNVEDIETSKNPTEKDTTTDEDDSDLEPIPNEEVAATSTNTLPEASVLPGRDAATQTKEQRAEENEMLMNCG